MKIKLNNNTLMDLPKLIESRLLVQANSGGGKSWAMRRIIEQAFGHVQIIVIDPEGEFGNMRSKFDFVYAGKDGDAPTESRSAALLARRLLELKASAIIDLYELPPQERKKYVRLFCEALVNAPKELWQDVLVIIDEAHVFAPEKDESEALGAVVDLASRGRKRGYCVVLATQRPAKLNKDAAAECNNKLIGRASLDIDRKRSAEELGFSSKEEVRSLRDLEPGEFYVFGPAISRDVEKITFGNVEVKPPKRGVSKQSVPAPSDHVKKMLAKLADLPQEAVKEATTIAELKKENAELKRVHTFKVKETYVPDRKQIDAEIAAAVKKAKQEKDDQFFAERDEWLKHMDTLFGIIKTIGEAMTEFKKTVTRKKLPPSPKWFPPQQAPTIKEVIKSPEIHSNYKVEIMGSGGSPDTEFTLSKSQQKILDSILWTEKLGMLPSDKTQIAFLSDQSPSSSGYANNLSALRTRGLISYPSSGTLSLTLEGRAFAQDSEMPVLNEDLHEQIYRKLSSSQVAILKVVINRYPNSISKTELAEAAGVSWNSSGYANNLSKLRTLKLIDYPSSGEVVAQKLLFIE